MRNILLTLVTVFAFVGCTKTEVQEKICDGAKTASAIVAAQVSIELACSNVDAIKKSIEDKLAEGKICVKAEEQKVADATVAAKGGMQLMGVISDALCTPVIEGMFAGGIQQLPKDWGCTGGQMATDFKAKMIAACSKSF